MHPIIDAHLDLSWNALSWNRDLTRSVEEIRQAEKGMTDTPARGRGTVALPDMRRGNVAACLATLLVGRRPEVHPNTGFKRTDLDFGNQQIASSIAHGQLAWYRILEQRGDIRFISDALSLETHFAAWARHPQSCPVGIILSMEGSDPILGPRQAQWWFDQGLRTAGLVHYARGPYAVGTGDNGPLTKQGVELLKEFERIGMILDLTHCSDESFYQAIDIFSGPVFASHQNCRALVAGDRQFSDDQIKRVIERGGVLGAALDSWMLYPGWKRGQTARDAVSIEAAADHIDHVCQLAGNARHCGIGSDLDGGFGTEQTPMGIETIADLQKFDAMLRKRGYSDEDVKGVLSGNFLRFFMESLPRDSRGQKENHSDASRRGVEVD